jgi:hypothetical protein
MILSVRNAKNIAVKLSGKNTENAHTPLKASSYLHLPSVTHIHQHGYYIMVPKMDIISLLLWATMNKFNCFFAITPTLELFDF